MGKLRKIFTKKRGGKKNSKGKAKVKENEEEDEVKSKKEPELYSITLKYVMQEPVESFTVFYAEENISKKASTINSEKDQAENSLEKGKEENPNSKEISPYSNKLSDKVNVIETEFKEIARAQLFIQKDEPPYLTHIIIHPDPSLEPQPVMEDAPKAATQTQTESGTIKNYIPNGHGTMTQTDGQNTMIYNSYHRNSIPIQSNRILVS